jgi:hypothetical protein
MNQNSLSVKRIVIIAVFGMLLLGTVFTLLALPNKNKQPTTDQTGTATNTTTDTTPVSYTGLGKLSQYGFSETQMSRFKNLLYHYNSKAKNIIVDPATIKQVGGYDPDNPSPYLEFDFDMLIDTKAYQTKLYKYNDFTNLRLILLETNGKQAFDSGEPAASATTNLDTGGD